MRYLLDGAEDAAALSVLIRESPLCGRLFVEDHEDALVLELRGASYDEARALIPGAVALRDAVELRDILTNHDDVFMARAALLGLGALWHSDLKLLDLLRELSTHPRTELRAGVVALASRYGYRLFLLELWARETDPVLRRILRSVTAFPAPEEAASEPGKGAP